MNDAAAHTEQTENVLARVRETLNGLRPFLQADGGDIEIVSLSDSLELQLRLTGNCEDCRMSHFTMKAGVETSLRKSIPELKEIITVE